MNCAAAVADWPFEFVTWTLLAPAVPAGDVARSCVELTSVTPVAATPPMRTVAPVAKFVPAIVITVPPAVGPLVGVKDVIVGVVGGTTGTA